MTGRRRDLGQEKKQEKGRSSLGNRTAKRTSAESASQASGRTAERTSAESASQVSGKRIGQASGRTAERARGRNAGRAGRGHLKWAAAAFWMGVWFVLAAVVDNDILLAAPQETAARMLSLLGEKSFYLSVGSSLLRIGAGFGAGLGLAVLLAAGSSRFALLEELLAPLMGLIKTVPVASFAVLLLIWWGPSALAASVSLLVVMPGVYFGVLEGLKSMNVRLLEMADVFRLPFRNRLFYLYRPELRPFLQGSIKAALGMCWKAGAAAEVIGIPARSIGEGLYLSKIYLDTAGVFAWTAAVVLASFLMEKLILALLERFFTWEPRCAMARPQGSAERPLSRKLSEKGALKQTAAVGTGHEGAAPGQAAGTASEGATPEQAAGTVSEGAAPEQAAGTVSEGAAPTVSVLRLQNITKSFDGTVVLDNISAACRPGETYLLSGPSGSGKTTLLRILAGLTEPDKGSCTVPGACSMVFQEDRLCEEYSAVKNLELVTGTGTEAGTEAEKALEALLGKAALHKPCSQLSGGMKRRVALVRAMEADSAYVLLDEPFTGMDGETRRLAQDYIRRKQAGRILVIASHQEGSGIGTLQCPSFHI